MPNINLDWCALLPILLLVIEIEPNLLTEYLYVNDYDE